MEILEIKPYEKESKLEKALLWLNWFNFFFQLAFLPISRLMLISMTGVGITLNLILIGSFIFAVFFFWSKPRKIKIKNFSLRIPPIRALFKKKHRYEILLKADIKVNDFADITGALHQNVIHYVDNYLHKEYDCLKHFSIISSYHSMQNNFICIYGVYDFYNEDEVAMLLLQYS